MSSTPPGFWSLTLYCANVVSDSHSVQAGGRVELLHARESFWRHKQYLALTNAWHSRGCVRQARGHGRSDSTSPRLVPLVAPYRGLRGQYVLWWYHICNPCLCGCVKVAEGQEICVIEAMKMQNSLTAVKPAKVTIWVTKSGTAVLAVQIRDFIVHVFIYGRNKMEFNLHNAWQTRERLY